MLLLRLSVLAAILLAMLLLWPEKGQAHGEQNSSTTQALRDRGRYIAMIGGCNDCHTPGFDMNAGQIPDEQWFVGNSMGFRGPWGTSYPTNLRLMVQRMSESEWITFVTTYEALPPMPYWALHNMDKEDLRAVYQFIHSLGPAGEEAPAPLPPDVEPSTPYIVFDPVFPASGGQ